MSFFDRIGQTLGITPVRNAAAQRKCYEYLKTALAKAQQKIVDLGGNPDEDVDYTAPTVDGKPPGEDPVSLLKNECRVLQDTISLIETSAGSYMSKKSTKFWKYWDKNKEIAVKLVEGEDWTRDKIRNKTEELEDGRS